MRGTIHDDDYCRISVRCPGLGHITILPFLSTYLYGPRLLVIILSLTALCLVVTIAVIESRAPQQHEWQKLEQRPRSVYMEGKLLYGLTLKAGLDSV